MTSMPGYAWRCEASGCISMFTLSCTDCCCADTPISVELACIADLNTDTSGAPYCCDLAVDLQTGCAFPARFAVHSPLAELRMARLWAWPATSGLTPIYDSFRQATLYIAPLGCKWEEWVLERLKLLAGLPDDELLELASTSPLHEGPSFLQGLLPELCVSEA